MWYPITTRNPENSMGFSMIGKEEMACANQIKGKAINLGRYRTQQEAAKIRTEAAYKNFGQFV